jgi:hypothetical protein
MAPFCGRFYQRQFRSVCKVVFGNFPGSNWTHFGGCGTEYAVTGLVLGPPAAKQAGCLASARLFRNVS